MGGAAPVATKGHGVYPIHGWLVHLMEEGKLP